MTAGEADPKPPIPMSTTQRKDGIMYENENTHLIEKNDIDRLVDEQMTLLMLELDFLLRSHARFDTYLTEKGLI